LVSDILRFRFDDSRPCEQLSNLATHAVLVRFPPQPIDFRRLFFEHFDDLRSMISSHADPGCLVVATSASRIESAAWIKADPGTINTAIIGRHDRCDVVLSGGADVSLRQIAAILTLDDARGGVSLQLVDLRTSAGMVDEHGRRWQSLATNGPIAVGCASRRIMAFPVDRARVAWPRKAESAWDLIPDRIYRESASVPPGASATNEGERAATVVGTLPGVIRSRPSMIESDEEPRGALHVRSAGREARWPVGNKALKRGILIGRYGRCDVGSEPLLVDPCFSRVHALVVEVRSRPYIIDTASKNGLAVGSRLVRSCALDEAETVSLAHGNAFLSWQSIH
jgi:hypothetical protein